MQINLTINMNVTILIPVVNKCLNLADKRDAKQL